MPRIWLIANGTCRALIWSGPDWLDFCIDRSRRRSDQLLVFGFSCGLTVLLFISLEGRNGFWNLSLWADSWQHIPTRWYYFPLSRAWNFLGSPDKSHCHIFCHIFANFSDMPQMGLATNVTCRNVTYHKFDWPQCILPLSDLPGAGMTQLRRIEISSFRVVLNQALGFSGRIVEPDSV